MSHVQVLQVLLPFVPGVVVTAGLALSGSSLAQRFWTIGLGYKTKLAVAISLAYILGLAMMTMTQSVNDLVMGKFKPPLAVFPWDNSYWRRVAAAYVGASLLPTPGPLSTQELDRFVDQISKMTPDAQAAVTRFREGAQNLENHFGELQRLEEQLSRSREIAAQAAQPKTAQIKELLNSTLDSIPKRPP